MVAALFHLAAGMKTLLDLRFGPHGIWVIVAG
jgi:hypothetical protein